LEIAQNHFISLLGFIIATMTCCSLLAQEKAALQPNATVLGILQGSVGKGVKFLEKKWVVKLRKSRTTSSIFRIWQAQNISTPSSTRKIFLWS